MKRREMADRQMTLFAIVFFIGGLLIGYVLNFQNIQECSNFQKPTPSYLIQGSRTFFGNGSASILLPAVMADGTGVSALLSVKAKEGSGKIFVRMDSMLINDDTQHSIRKAALVAAKLANINLSTVDLVYELNATATELEGASAGAAIAVATYAALTNSTLRNDVMMTGSINHDGTVGLASKVIEKAKVADDLGMKYFLVPRGTKQEYKYEEKEFCYEWQKGVEFCEQEYVAEKTDLWNLSVKIMEVGTIEEALSYFLE